MYRTIERLAVVSDACEARSSKAARAIKELGYSLAAAAVLGVIGGCSPDGSGSTTVDGEASMTGVVLETKTNEIALPIRINTGGDTYLDQKGNRWYADAGFNTGVTAVVTTPIEATEDDTLYQSYRYDDGTTPELTYAFDVPNGDYQVKLHFAETWGGAFAAGKRVFGVQVEGQSVESALDIYAAVGANTPLVKSYTAKVTDGRLEIDFIHKVQNPTISALEIVRLDAIRVNAGGGDYQDDRGNQWLADIGYNTGVVGAVTTAIEGTENDFLYQSYRYDALTSPELSYAFDLPDGDYQVNLHFAETWGGAFAVGERVFGVQIEGQTVESALDVFAAVGANKALVKSYTASVTDGQLHIDFLHKVQNPIISAIEILKLEAIRVNAGGGEIIDNNGNKWVADTGSNTGITSVIATAIEGTENDALYQSYRYDDATLPELSYLFDVPNGSYKVNLHFAETWGGAFVVGKRVFGVQIEGQTVESALDIFALAGANTALVRSYTANVTDGQLRIDFIHKSQNPTISGIELLGLANTQEEEVIDPVVDDEDSTSTGDTSDTTDTGDTSVPVPPATETEDSSSSTDGTTDTSDTSETIPAPVNAVPTARADAFSVEDGVPAVLNVLANDTGLTDLPVILTIPAQPAHGTAQIQADSTIVYTATSGYAGADSFTYRISDGNGDTALASVSLEVACTSCPVERVMTLSWSPNPDEITGYQVFRGPTAEQATQLVTDLPLNSGLVDPTAPQIEYRANADLGLTVGEEACFRVKAYNNEAFSDYSQAVCGVN